MTPDPTPLSLFSTRSQAPLLPPPPIPDHELIRPIGRGAYGEVWIARSVTGAYRAVKIVRRSSFEHDRPFEREFEGIQRFEPISHTHDSQVDILHVGRGEDHFYYVMELADDQVTGGQINPDNYHPRTVKSDLLFHSRLSFESCVSIGIALTTALEHLHQKGLAHRDVKPSNIIFVNGVAKLADIGLVTGLDTTRSFVGTEGFAAPEGPGTAQADLYSLGKVLYEMSTGKDRQEFPELPTNLRELPEREGLVELNAVIAKACRHDPGDRYATAAAMRVDLELLQSGKSLAHFHRCARASRTVRRMGNVIGAFALIIVTSLWIEPLWPNEESAHENSYEHSMVGHLAGGATGQDNASSIVPGWGIAIDPDDNCEIFTDNGALKISIPPNIHELAIHRFRMNAPRVLRAVNGDFSAQVEVSDFAQVDNIGQLTFRSAGLLIWQNPYNYIVLQITKPPIGSGLQTPSTAITCTFWINGENNVPDKASPGNSIGKADTPSHLRIERRGISILAYTSDNGVDWELFSEFEFALKSQVNVGPIAEHNSGARFTVRFAKFIVSTH